MLRSVVGSRGWWADRVLIARDEEVDAGRNFELDGDKLNTRAWAVFAPLYLSADQAIRRLECLREKRSERIAKSAFESWNWQGLLSDARDNIEADDMGDGFVGSAYMGSCLDCPSGKYYTPWASSNLSPCHVCGGSGKLAERDCPWCAGEGGSYGKSEAVDDEAWYAGLEEGAESVGGSIGSGEGDACDLFLFVAWDTDPREV